jgi:hypothetical protein
MDRSDKESIMPKFPIYGKLVLIILLLLMIYDLIKHK